MIVKKAYGMAKQMNIPVLGIVENYSYVKCPDCGKELKVFGESHIEEIAAELGVPVLGKMPIDRQSQRQWKKSGSMNGESVSERCGIVKII